MPLVRQDRSGSGILSSMHERVIKVKNEREAAGLEETPGSSRRDGLRFRAGDGKKGGAVSDGGGGSSLEGVTAKCEVYASWPQTA